MKIPFKFLTECITTDVQIDDLSKKLFQLGHEHIIEENEMFNFDITPNRGDCLSLNGILRELNSFYEIKNVFNIYEQHIEKSDIKFTNNAKDLCPYISFLNIEIEESYNKNFYEDYLERYFKALNIKKVNFFTDISNYISYELGQPTHCYDSSKISKNIVLEELISEEKFTTLTNEEKQLINNDLVFRSNNKTINLAGIMGAKNSMCENQTKCVTVECAYFLPESIIGRSLQLDIKSDAAHKFERSTDPLCHDLVLRRFIKIVSDHVKIKKISLGVFNQKNYLSNKISIDIEKINQIIGIKIDEQEYKKILTNLGFEYKKNICVPSWRSDVSNQNDLAEEVARVVGFDKIKPKTFICKNNNSRHVDKKEEKIIQLLIDNGFTEVVNFPFIANSTKESIKVDNPIDSTKPFLRTFIKESLLNNLIFNERRQHDSIKFFEISDIYIKKNNKLKKESRLGIIGSGRVGKNFEDFSKIIDTKYFNGIFVNYIDNKNLNIHEIPRDNLDTKKTSKIVYLEIDLKDISDKIFSYKTNSQKPKDFISYKKISEFPCIIRDISFAIDDFNEISKIEDLIINYSNKILSETYIFDYFYNEKVGEVKIGFRFKFQTNRTLMDAEVDEVINDIISISNNLCSVRIPGYKQ
tara:strand:- start:579 stop:2495 length:1917 start_codon:yes stop_codon:yes gene_type:complete